MSDVTLTLGDFVFQDFEVPDRINIGGKQLLIVHELVGGKRVIDAMGRSDAPVRWDGRFRGSNAVQRADAVDAMRIAGQPVSLTWGDYSLTVLVEDFGADYEKPFEIPYFLVCVVLSNDSDLSAAPGVDEQILGDNTSIQSLGQRIIGAVDAVKATIANARSVVGQLVNSVLAPAHALSGLLVDLQSAVDLVPSFAHAELSAIRSVLGPLASVQVCTSQLITTYEATTDSVAAVGGVFSGGRPQDMADQVTAQVMAMTQTADLYDLHNLAGRMATNLAAIGAGGAVVTVAGSNLFEIAALYYGDAQEWATIAKANGLTEPMLAGVQTLVVPPIPGNTGGVLKEIIGVAPAASPIPAGDGGMLDFEFAENSDLLTV